MVSANTEQALTANMKKLLDWLESNPDVSLRDLTWSLWMKRSALAIRRAVPAQTISSLITALQQDLGSGGKRATPLLQSEMKQQPAILGIFTGQGAQWPGMGKALLSASSYARDIVSQLDESLQTLPHKYRPSWSLVDELCLEKDASHVSEASFSQPLCCAVQIVLVKLMEAAGIRFKAVVGHSSGEIACAFAAGFITPRQAIRIAYLRGFISHLASSPTGSRGAMLAAGTTYEDATELCSFIAPEGQICVAASNSTDSVTLSGDADYIQQARGVLEDESKFARTLMVDKAYHSHHMIPCRIPYLEAMQECDCTASEITPKPGAPIWISSVYEGKCLTAADITADYFTKNLTLPVLFFQAMKTVISEHLPFHAAIEVGPHPALRNPCLSTTEKYTGKAIPYIGCLNRNLNDLDAFSSTVGFLYEVFGSRAVDIDGLNKVFWPSQPVKSLAGELPLHSWDHTRTYGHQSRVARNYLCGMNSPPHLLLGKPSPNSTASNPQWHKYLRSGDLSWIKGHKLQGRIVFPGAAYILMAMEAAMSISAEREVQLLEVLNLKMEKAITFDDDESVVEINTVVNISETQSTDCMQFDFRISSCLAKDQILSQSASGQVIVTFGSGSMRALPLTGPEPPHTNKVNVDSLYRSIRSLGYEYEDEFCGITSMRRADRAAYGTLALHKLKDGDYTLLMHPATLDLALQTFFGANSAPGEKRLRSLIIPTTIGRVAFNPWLSRRSNASLEQLGYHSSAVGDPINVFDPRDMSTICQIEDIAFQSIIPPSSKNDREVFSKWVWGPLEPSNDPDKYTVTAQDEAYASVVERITYFYIRSFLQNLPDSDLVGAEFHLQCYIRWCRDILREARAGQHPWYSPVWETDTESDILHLIEHDAKNSPDSRLIRRVGENLLRIIRSNENPFSLMDHDGLLTEYYRVALGFGPLQVACQDIVSQITHRYQNMDILEIGAGTGGATKFVLGSDQFSCSSYTFTDISTAFFENAQHEFADHGERMHFRALDISSDPIAQGFREHGYDLIIASNVLHATPKLEDTMTNVRRLLKPGGSLVISEITQGHLQTRGSVIFGLFPDWWASVDGRSQPFVTMEKWDMLLKNSGFSGIDCRIPHRDDHVAVCSTFSTHAVDQMTERLWHPLRNPSQEPLPPLIVVGGQSQRCDSLLRGLSDVLCDRPITMAHSIRDISESELQPLSTFLILSELDKELFSELNRETFESLKHLFFHAKNLLWVTEDAWCDHPNQATTIGFLRSIRAEYPDSNIQVLDFDSISNIEPTFLVEHLLRLEASDAWTQAGVVWTKEPEIYVSKEKALVPRLKPDVPRNNRLNSTRRHIAEEVNPEFCPVELLKDNKGAFLQIGGEFARPRAENPALRRVRVHHALTQALRVNEQGYFYLLQGTDTISNQPVLALSETHSSLVAVNASQTVALPTDRDVEPGMLSAIAAELVAEVIISGVSSGASVMVLEPWTFARESIQRRADASGILVVFLFHNGSERADTEFCRSVHAKDSQSVLRRFIPEGLAAFYDLSGDSSPSSLGKRLLACIPETCISYQSGHFVQRSASSIPRSIEPISQTLNMAMYESTQGGKIYEIDVVSARALNTQAVQHDPFIVCDWTIDGTVLARNRPIDTGNIFSEGKTYLLCGLTGDLGRSLCRYMIAHGARHIVLSSRNPNIDGAWVDSMAQIGGNIVVIPM